MVTEWGQGLCPTQGAERGSNRWRAGSSGADVLDRGGNGMDTWSTCWLGSVTLQGVFKNE